MKTKEINVKGKKKRSFAENLFSQYELVRTLICLMAVLGAIAIRAAMLEEWRVDELFELKTFAAVVTAFILDSITKIIISAVRAKKEDSEKLTTDYDKLAKMYLNAPPIVFTNSSNCSFKIGRKNMYCAHKETKNGEDTYLFPITHVVSFIGKEIKIDDNPNDFYRLPNKIDGVMADLYNAHNFSKTYNQLSIRCCGINDIDENIVNIKFSRTTYFHSLITNRAMDFKIDGICVRDLCGYGPFLNSLEESELSNHIGYNGFVETKDNYVVFIFRHKHVSIAKNTLQTSVGASLKAKYALDDKRNVTKDGIVAAIRKEIEDELNLANIDKYKERYNDIFANLTFKSILCFYRELVEGGKPQLMFYTKINISKDELISAYQNGVKNIKKSKDKYTMWNKTDGYKMLLVHRKDLNSLYITPDGITIGKKFYKSVPTSSGTLVLFLRYLETGNVI